MSRQVYTRLLSLLAIVAVIVMVQDTTLAQQSDLRYQWEKGKQFAYEVTVTVDSPTSVPTYKGITRYTVEASDDKQPRLTYRGGTSESSKSKASARSRGFRPFGPFGQGRPSFPDPFGSNDPKSVQAASELTSYTIASKDAQQATIKKTDHLNNAS